MRRSSLLSCVLAVVAIAAISHAHWSVEGRVATPGAPNLARYAYATGLNGVTGHVFRLPDGADGMPYTLERTAGATGAENLDAYFYEDISGLGEPCGLAVAPTSTPERETGTICPGPQHARWAVVVLRVGAGARFRFTV